VRATRQLNVRVRVDLHDRYRALLRALEDAGVETSMSELVHALLEQGPRDVDAAIDVLRRWRQVSTDL
jgi:predicted nucleic acid-binding protein